ncbi:MAG TPA: hypothetical protein VGF23_05395 [Gaiellaceae bacterium]|jgi:hypothetical protein
MARSYDPRNGRPLEGEREAIETLTDEELEVELFVAAAAAGKKRVERLALLTGELERRRSLRQLVDVTS